MTKKKKEIGITANIPNKKCTDVRCPFHGNLKVRGRSFVGVVSSTKMQKTITVEWPRLSYLKKYERYEKKKTKITAHVPGCMKVNRGDKVRIHETRPLSKTKNFVVVEVLGQDISFIAKEEGILASKVKRKEKTEDEKKESSKNVVKEEKQNESS